MEERPASQKGAEVREYETDYQEAGKQGRDDSAKTKNTYFIDD